MGIAYNTSIVRDGLVLHLDAANPKSYTGSGISCKDLSFNKLNGTLNNGTTFNTNNQGSFVFDGTNDYISFGSIFTYLDLTDRTIQCWVLNEKLTGIKGVIDKGFDNGSSYSGWGFWLSSDNKLQWWNSSNKDLVDDGPISIPTNVWTNIAVTYNNNTKTANFYINSTLNSTKTNTTISENGSTSTMCVGSIRNGTNFFFDGHISNITAYNRLLTEYEIKQNFEALRGRYGV